MLAVAPPPSKPVVDLTGPALEVEHPQAALREAVFYKPRGEIITSSAQRTVLAHITVSCPTPVRILAGYQDPSPGEPATPARAPWTGDVVRQIMLSVLSQSSYTIPEDFELNTRKFGPLSGTSYEERLSAWPPPAQAWTGSGSDVCRVWTNRTLAHRLPCHVRGCVSTMTAADSMADSLELQ